MRRPPRGGSHLRRGEIIGCVGIVRVGPDIGPNVDGLRQALLRHRHLQFVGMLRQFRLPSPTGRGGRHANRLRGNRRPHSVIIGLVPGCQRGLSGRGVLHHMPLRGRSRIRCRENVRPRAGARTPHPHGC